MGAKQSAVCLLLHREYGGHGGVAYSTWNIVVAIKELADDGGFRGFEIDGGIVVGKFKNEGLPCVEGTHQNAVPAHLAMVFHGRNAHIVDRAAKGLRHHKMAAQSGCRQHHFFSMVDVGCVEIRYTQTLVAGKHGDGFSVAGGHARS